MISQMPYVRPENRRRAGAPSFLGTGGATYLGAVLAYIAPHICIRGGAFPYDRHMHRGDMCGALRCLRSSPSSS